MMAMQEETQLLYQKYGISPMGSCVQMLIQMPILFALYRVFYNIPAYLSGVKGSFTGLVDSIQQTSGYQNTLVKVTLKKQEHFGKSIMLLHQAVLTLQMRLQSLPMQVVIL